MKASIKELPNNNRFYVLVFSFLLSIFVICWLRLQVADDTLFVMRLQQTFGFLAAGFLYVSLIISPIRSIIGSPDWMKNLIFARRAIGATVLYFALMHALLALWGQLGGLEGLTALPGRFVWPLIFGATALIILCVMAVTSLDKMVILLTFPVWKQVQRLTYICSVLVILHVWAIGAHFSSVWSLAQSLSFAALAVLFGLEAWRIALFWSERRAGWQPVKKQLLFWSLWIAGVALLLWLTLSGRPAGAHMLSKDTATNTGAILHITPDDDPIAGEPALLVFDIEDMPQNPQGAAKLTITDDHHNQAQITGDIRGKAVSAEYTFPQQGLYSITLVVEAGGTTTHSFTQSQRVSRGILINATAPSAPLWAGAGLLGSVVTAAALAGIAFRRRKAIGIYSKL